MKKILWRLLNIKVALEHFSRFRAIRRNKCDGHTMYESFFIATNVISSSFLEFGTPELDLRHATLMWKIHEKVRFWWWSRTSDANKKFLVGRMNMLWVSKMFSERRGTQRTSNHDRTIPHSYYFCENVQPPLLATVRTPPLYLTVSLLNMIFSYSLSHLKEKTHYRYFPDFERSLISDFPR